MDALGLPEKRSMVDVIDGSIDLLYPRITVKTRMTAAVAPPIRWR
jgi:hypothetical protein